MPKAQTLRGKMIRAALLDNANAESPRTIAELADQFGISINGMKRHRQRLYDEGVLSLINKPWTLSDDLVVETWIDKGYTAAKISQRLGRTHEAVLKRIAALGLKIDSTLSFVRPRDFAQMMGVSIHIVLGWIEAKFLRVKRVRQGLIRTLTQISWDSVWAFLRDERYWALWSLEAIVDADIRDFVTPLRSNATWHWMTTAECAVYWHVDEATISWWIREQCLPALQLKRRWYVDSRVAAQFVPPYRNQAAASL